MFLQFGNLKTGWMFHKKKSDLIKASNVVFFERRLIEYFLSNYHQGWMSQEAQAEAFNETWRDTLEVQLVKKFLDQNPSVGAQFNKKTRPEDTDFVFNHLDEENLELETSPERKSPCVMYEMHRKSVGQAYYSVWVPEELNERNLAGKYLFGPFYQGIQSTCIYSIEY